MTKTICPLRRLSLPVAARQMGRVLLEQQCWCWGQDIKRGDGDANGNLLRQYGFARVPPPDAARGATAYSCQRADVSLMLWGFGFYCGCGASAIYVGRFDFAPQWCQGDVPQAFAPPHVAPQSWPGLRAAQTAHERRQARELLWMAMREFARYERWVLDCRGHDYRCACLSAWNAASPLSPESVAPAWEQLARACRYGRTCAGTTLHAHPTL